MSSWKRVNPIEHWNAPNKPAVYVIYLDGRPVYVGQTTRLRTRLEQHKFNWGYSGRLITPWGEFHTDTKIRCKYRLSRRAGDWLMWELRLIWKLQPIYNVRSRLRVVA